MSMFINTKKYQNKFKNSNQSKLADSENSDSDSDSILDSSYDSDEYDYPVKCTCGWRCEYPESHVEHSKMFGCDYIQWKYHLSYDSDGELIAEPKKIANVEKKPTKKKPIPQMQSKDGCFDICGKYGKDTSKCSCAYCKGRMFSISDDENWLATKLKVDFENKNIVKAKGALWSPIEKVWFVRASNKNYKELCDKF